MARIEQTPRESYYPREEAQSKTSTLVGKASLWPADFEQKVRDLLSAGPVSDANVLKNWSRVDGAALNDPDWELGMWKLHFPPKNLGWIVQWYGWLPIAISFGLPRKEPSEDEILAAYRRFEVEAQQRLGTGANRDPRS